MPKPKFITCLFLIGSLFFWGSIAPTHAIVQTEWSDTSRSEQPEQEIASPEPKSSKAWWQFWKKNKAVSDTLEEKRVETSPKPQKNKKALAEKTLADSLSSIAMQENYARFVEIEDDSIYPAEMIAQMDALMDEWQIQKTTLSRRIETENIYGYDTADVPVFSDSVLAKRLYDLHSPIPMDFNPIVKRYIELYTIEKREQVENMLRLSEYYFPLFEEQLDRYDLPLEFRALPVIESALNPNAVSRVGATGIWQFMYTTGKLYGLEVTSYVDERRDPHASTLAAIHYLQDMHRIFKGDWLLMIASYNCGAGNVRKAIRRSGYKKDFWAVYPYLPRETRGYVPAFIAANYVFAYHQSHNLYPNQSLELPLSVDTIVVDRPMDFEQLSKHLDISLEALQWLNPQFKKGHIPAGKKHYTLNLPLQKCFEFCEIIDSVFITPYEGGASFAEKPERMVKAKTQASTSPVKPAKPSEAEDENYAKLIYTVRSGDDLGHIAEWYQCRASDLRRWNNMYGSALNIGQKLTVYVPKEKEATFAKINKMTFAQKQATLKSGADKQEESVTASSSQTKNKSTDSKYEYYTIKKGDNLWRIALQYDGVSSDDIMRINNIKRVQDIKPGDVIKIQKP